MSAARVVSRIVVGVDGSEHARRALSWALDEARRHGAAVEIVHAVPDAGAELAAASEDGANDVMRAAVELLDDQVSALNDAAGRRAAPDPVPEVCVTRTIVAGRPADVLVQRSREADLLVVGTRGHGGFAGLLLGAVGLHAVTHAACPVAVVPNARRSAARSAGDLLAGGRRTRRVVVGVDDGGTSRRAVELAAVHARAHNAVLELVSAYHELPAIYYPYMAGGSDLAAHTAYRDRLRREADERLQAEARVALHAGAPAVERRAVPGPPAATLLDAARGADLLVVGSSGRREVTGALLGSVGQQCVTHAPCPVIVVPPRERDERVDADRIARAVARERVSASRG